MGRSFAQTRPGLRTSRHYPERPTPTRVRHTHAQKPCRHDLPKSQTARNEEYVGDRVHCYKGVFELPCKFRFSVGATIADRSPGALTRPKLRSATRRNPNGGIDGWRFRPLLRYLPAMQPFCPELFAYPVPEL